MLSKEKKLKWKCIKIRYFSNKMMNYLYNNIGSLFVQLQEIAKIQQQTSFLLLD